MNLQLDIDGVARSLEEDVGRRWLDETRSFLSQLDRVKARRETSLMKKRAGQAWRLRRHLILVCAVVRAVATSTLESPRTRVTDRVSLNTGESR